PNLWDNLGFPRDGAGGGKKRGFSTRRAVPAVSPGVPFPSQFGVAGAAGAAAGAAGAAGNAAQGTHTPQGPHQGQDCTGPFGEIGSFGASGGPGVENQELPGQAEALPTH
ncbi:hypothetical protein HGM15179_021312, partial [Zosterops borbonicus]